MLLKIHFTAKQSEFERTIRETPVTFFGGAKGGGKSAGLRLIMLKRRVEYDGSKGVIFRKTYPELEANHIRPLFEQYPGLKQYYNEGKKILTLPNKSTLEFRHCMRASDVKLYQGQEFHDLAIEEAGEWLEQWFQTLRGSNRSGKPGIKPRAILTGNPGGIGHQWLKRLFITKRYNERERASDYAFVKALVSDNPFILEHDPDYVRRLEAEPNEMLRRAYRHGDWDIAAGQFFSEFDRDVHVLPRDFPIQKHWTRFGSYDYGFGHPCAAYRYAVDEDGSVYVYWELVRANLRVDQQAEIINQHNDKMPYWTAGRDCWNQRGQKGPTIAEEFHKYGIYLKPANVDRRQGATQIRQYLAWKKTQDGKRIGPRVFILESCPILIDCITRMTHDPNDVEDVLKVDSTDGDVMEGDDPYDSFRYGLMSRPIKTPGAKPRRGDSYDDYGNKKTNSWTIV